MPKQTYAIERGGPKRVELEWRGLWKEMQVRLDGQLLGQIADGKALKEGRTFPTPSGGTLRVQLVQTFASAELHVLHNNTPLPGTAADPRSRLNIAAGVIYFVGGLNVLLGVIAEVGHNETLQNMGLGWISGVVGVIYLALAALVHLKRSAVALGFAMAVVAANLALGLWADIAEGGSPRFGPVIFQMLMLAWMYRGFAAIKQLKNEAVHEPARPPPATGIAERGRGENDPFEPPRN